MRGRQTDEPLGGAASPVLNLPGKSEIVFTTDAAGKVGGLTLIQEQQELQAKKVR